VCRAAGSVDFNPASNGVAFTNPLAGDKSPLVNFRSWIRRLSSLFPGISDPKRSFRRAAGRRDPPLEIGGRPTVEMNHIMDV
jgi:hypothetical protein